MSEELDTLEPIEFPHGFDLEIGLFVLTNYTHTLHGIEKDEQETLEKIQGASDAVHLVENEIYGYFEQLRVASIHLALVGLVIRLEHWANDFKRAVPSESGDTSPSCHESTLARDLDMLNGCLGKAPVSVDFFEHLAFARNSVVHGDSKASWLDEKGKRKHVDKRYASDFGELKFAEEELNEAVERARQLVKWYDEKLHETKRKAIVGTS
jgi:hypothetical protein